MGKASLDNEDNMTPTPKSNQSDPRIWEHLKDYIKARIRESMNLKKTQESKKS